MKALIQEQQNPKAAIINNIIINDEGLVIGILLGNCVFGRNGSLKAKYFANTLYLVDGTVLAKTVEKMLDWPIDFSLLLSQAWNTIQKIKDHNCPYIIPTNRWTRENLVEYFNR